MSQTIRERADTIGTLRHISVFLMETLARWVPTTPELEAKVLFGRHVWEFAQHADLLGKRTAELRAALHYNLSPTAAYAALLQDLANTEATASRIRLFYEGMLPELAARYGQYLGATDQLLDEPSVRIIERILPDLDRMRRDAAAAVTEYPSFGSARVADADHASARFALVTNWVAHRAPAATSGALE